MCGIAGLFFKNKTMEPLLGQLFSEMLDCMSSRGSDSAGFAVYGKAVQPGFLKLTLQHADPQFHWKQLSLALQQHFKQKPQVKIRSNHAVLTMRGKDTALQQFIREKFPKVNIMSIGRRIEIMKETGLPCTVLDRFQVKEMTGSHAIGHTRMATESAVTTAGSHPFSTGQDFCLVHNGSLSNHNTLRRMLRREGLTFQTENDSEVAAGYLTWRLREGDTLHQALEKALNDFDGFYTFTIGTRDGFAVLRDPIACKPAVMAETKDYVAMASEYRSLAALPGIEKARLWEPEPAKIYTWNAKNHE